MASWRDWIVDGERSWRLEVGSVIQAKSSDHPLDLRKNQDWGEKSERCAVDRQFVSSETVGDTRERRTLCGTAVTAVSAGDGASPLLPALNVQWLQLDEELRFQSKPSRCD